MTSTYTAWVILMPLGPALKVYVFTGGDSGSNKTHMLLSVQGTDVLTGDIEVLVALVVSSIVMYAVATVKLS